MPENHSLNEQQYHIVIIESSDADRFLYYRSLKNTIGINFLMTEYTSIAEFKLNRRIHRTQLPDVIVLDYSSMTLPFEKVVQEIKYDFPELPIAVSVELQTQKLIEEFSKLGVFGIIEKNHIEGEYLANHLVHTIKLHSHIKDNLHKANYDPLTGLANRSFFQQRTEHAISLCQRTHKTLGFLLLDLDDFKIINDHHGHDFGDHFLKNIAIRLKDSVRVSDTVARLGGDEFAILLEGVESPELTVYLTKKIISNISEPLSIKGKKVIPSLSIGLTMLNSKNIGRFSFDWLLQSADIALYEAKRQGKNTYSVFTDEQDSEMLKNLEMEDQLTDAIKNKEFQLYYQPIYSISQNQISGFEALLRWKRADGEMLSPDHFLDNIEKMGLMQEVGEIVVEESLCQFSEWLKYDEELILHINISPAQFMSDGFHSNMNQLLDKFKIPGNQIKLELTERNLFRSTEKLQREFAKLELTGVKLAIDDFGMGYGSFDYIRKFRIDTLKLDKSYIQAMFSNPVDMAIIESVINLAGHLGFKLVAEGVEKKSHYDYLSSLGVDLIQGYYKGRPMPAEQIQRLFTC